MMMKNLPCTFYEGFHDDSAKQYSNDTLKLKKNLYGLNQASYSWSKLLNGGLFKPCFKPSKIDLFL